MSDTTKRIVLDRRATEAGITLLHPDNAQASSVRVAIQQVGENKRTTMKILNKQDPLVNIVKDLCSEWKLDDPDAYQLQFDDTKVLPPPIYITEENRAKMADGDILKLDFSPMKMSKILTDSFEKGSVSQSNMERLASLSVDITFVDRFVTSNGYVALSKLVVGLPAQGPFSAINGPALAALVNLMDHKIVSWETMSTEMLKSVLWHLDDKHKPDLLVMKSALAILECAVQHSSVGQKWAVEPKFDLRQFISTLKTRDVEIQVSCISLINNILSVSELPQRQHICKQLRSHPIRQHIWETIFTGPIGSEMGYQLYSLQTRLVNLLAERMNGAIKVTDPAALKEVMDLRQIAFDDESEAQQRESKNDFKDFTKLGFKDSAEPLAEFSQAPPGALALDCMAFFAHQYTQQYRQVVLENSRERADEQDCPFAQASVELTKILAEIFKIGVPPSDEPGRDDRTYYPIFFSKEKPFEECFCVCIQRLTKTWKEMKACISDFNKVLMVVKEQITRALNAKPHTFDSMKNKLTTWSFSKIQEARQKELEDQEELKRQAKPIQELREMLRPELEDVIKQQRINRMVEGCYFKMAKNYKAAKAERFLYCRLSHNAKVLHYGSSATDQGVPETSQSLNVLDIVDVSESDDTKTKVKAITITKQGGEELQLNTDQPMDHDTWLDGLNALTGNKPIISEQARRQLDELLSMELKLRLLDAEGIDFPEQPPPIPEPPADFNFVTA